MSVDLVVDSREMPYRFGCDRIYLEEVERGQWGRQIEFILTMVGYAVGLGNVWRFPYLCYKNGGGLGMTILSTSAIVFIYYNIIIAWSLNYLYASLTSRLPWVDCSECSCLLYEMKNVTSEELEILKVNNSLGVVCPDLDPNATKSPSEIYYKQDILHDSGTITEIGDVQWHLVLGNFVAYAVIFLVLVKGIQSLGKVVYFTAIFPYILLTILLVRSAMLDGSLNGVEYYLTPKWERLKDATVWTDAATQIFFSLSACLGGLIAMSSYNKFDNNIMRDAFMIPIINCGTSFYAGFVVFSTLGNMAAIKNVGVEDVTDQGPGLAFVVYPEALSKMPVSVLWAILFFFMLCILGFSTQFSAAETIMTSVMDDFPKVFAGKRARQILFRISVCLVAFVLGIPMVAQGGQHLFYLVDGAVLEFPLLFVGLFEYIAIIHIYGYNNFAEDIYTMLGRKPMFYFKATWVVLAPLMLLGIIVYTAYNGKEFEVPWAGLLYYLIVIFILMWIPVWYFYYTCRKGVWGMMRPEQAWKDRRLLNPKTQPQVENGVNKEGLRYSTEGLQGHLGEYTVHIQASPSSPGNSDASNSIQMVEKPRYGVDNAAYLNNETANQQDTSTGVSERF
ncbi:sodium- and chloride-dependent glycine transporter 1-like [Elysia marginata]|uniref:Sodium- and chloride-dependent glycine transporter 1-like n=1 Tax=Elysia marginata TaxID=1093978 RepID=A0AAV4FHV3_9GAST|nr:sodium- and chloride-dependent glycine transporter 1-like [Elysia marginata]